MRAYLVVALLLGSFPAWAQFSISGTCGAATSTSLGCVKAGAGIAVAGDGTISASGTAGVGTFNGRTGSVTLVTGDVTAVYTPPAASTTVAGVVKVDGTTVTIAGGVISAAGGGAASTAFVRGAYTASGAISLANTLAVLNGSTGTLAMTLANGTTDGQPLLIKILGTASATVAITLDGASQSVALTGSAPGTIRDALKLRWSVVDASWLAE